MADMTLLQRIAMVTLRKFFNLLGWMGLLFILYGVVSIRTGSIWEPLERWVNPTSAFLTLLGTLLTAASVYFYTPQSRAPELFSKYVSAPLVIGAAIITIGWLFRMGTVPPVVINGFALLGIAGGLFRIQSNPGES